jgi:hypothetical protein
MRKTSRVLSRDYPVVGLTGAAAGLEPARNRVTRICVATITAGRAALSGRTAITATL